MLNNQHSALIGTLEINKFSVVEKRGLGGSQIWFLIAIQIRASMLL